MRPNKLYRAGAGGGWLRIVSSTHFSTSLSRSSMLFARRSFSYRIQHLPFASSGVSAACLAGGGGARGAPCTARPAGAGGAVGGEGWAAGGAAAICGSGVAGERSDELVLAAQPASATRARRAIRLREILGMVSIIRPS